MSLSLLERAALALIVVPLAVLALPFKRVFYPTPPKREPTEKELADYHWDRDRYNY